MSHDGRPGTALALPDRPRGVRRAGLEPGPAWPGEEAPGLGSSALVRAAHDPRIRPGQEAAGRGTR